MFVKTRRVLRNWPIVFVENHLTTGNRLEYKLKNGPRFLVRTRTQDAWVIYSVYAEKCYLAEDMKIGENDTVVDVGAHIGAFSLFASLHATRGRVFAVEPEPESFQMLEHNIQINNARNLVPLRMAISGRTEPRILHLSGSSLEHSIVSGAFDGPTHGETEVQSVSLKDFMNRQYIPTIDFLKLNCEGAEYEILFGSDDETLRRINGLVVQYHDIGPGKDERAMREFLTEKGFKILPFCPKGYRMIFAKRMRSQ